MQKKSDKNNSDNDNNVQKEEFIHDKNSGFINIVNTNNSNNPILNDTGSKLKNNKILVKNILINFIVDYFLILNFWRFATHNE